MYRIGADVGGTFTDLAAVDRAGRVVIAKCASTPRDPSEGLMEGLGLLASELGLDPSAFFTVEDRMLFRRKTSAARTRTRTRRRV